MARHQSKKIARIQVHPILYQLCRSGERFEVGDGPISLEDVESLVLGRGVPRKSRKGKACVDDPWMSSRHARVVKNLGGHIRGSGRYYVEDIGSTNGVLVNGEPVDQRSLHHGDLIETGRTFWLYQENPAPVDVAAEPTSFGTWVTWNPDLASDLIRLRENVHSLQNILLTGPEGVGKGYMARTIHLMSRRIGRFIHLDCAERSESRLQIDLMGGMGTPSRVDDARGGTLFLENVDALSAAMQDEFGAYLSERENTDEESDQGVCIITSMMVASKTAKHEIRLEHNLRDVLAQMIVHVPGLKDRQEDFGLLLDDFLARARGAMAIHRDACRAVFNYGWRMHVKAFSRVIEAAATLAAVKDADSQYKGGRIELKHLPLEVVGRDPDKSGSHKMRALEKPPSWRADDRLFAHSDGLQEDAELTEAVPMPRGDITSEMPNEDQNRTDDLAKRIQKEVPEDGAFEEGVLTDPLVQREGQGDNEPQTDDVSEQANRFASIPSELSHSQSALIELKSMERSYATAIDPDLIVDALQRSRGNISGAARFLGKPRAMVQKWMNEFQLSVDDYREG